MLSFRFSLAAFSILSCGLVASATGCGGTDANSLCERTEDACGKKQSAESIKSCKESVNKCKDTADDFASCADGNFECVDGNEQLKKGKCESEAGAYFICALSGLGGAD